ncbi:MAG TPA: CGNR zinc finger domain-containing protein [Streptosporangiaceae bacterium]|nr:CGNR zinc finger domain-containing protein [Streptosporangiaceae bacterium]
MDLSSYAELAVRLANSAADGEEGTDGEPARGNIVSLDGLRALLTDLEFAHSGTTRGDLDAMRGLRTELREIFSACAAGNGAEAVDRLNGLLVRHPAHPQISGHDGEPWHLHLAPSGCVCDRYAAAAAMGLAAMLTRHGTCRFRFCTAPSCQQVFIDTTTNGSRRYCSVRCSSRVNLTALRERRRTGGGAAIPAPAI